METPIQKVNNIMTWQKHVWCNANTKLISSLIICSSNGVYVHNLCLDRCLVEPVLFCSASAEKLRVKILRGTTGLGFLELRDFKLRVCSFLKNIYKCNMFFLLWTCFTNPHHSVTWLLFYLEKIKKIPPIIHEL